MKHLEEIVQNIKLNNTDTFEDCEFTNCYFGNIKITQGFLIKHPNFVNCIETNLLHSNKNMLNVYKVRRRRQRDNSVNGSDLTFES